MEVSACLSFRRVVWLEMAAEEALQGSVPRILRPTAAENPSFIHIVLYVLLADAHRNFRAAT